MLIDHLSFLVELFIPFCPFSLITIFFLLECLENAIFFNIPLSKQGIRVSKDAVNM